MLFGVPVTWCAGACNEDDFAGESWYTENVCLQRDSAYNKYACNEYLLYPKYVNRFDVQL